MRALFVTVVSAMLLGAGGAAAQITVSNQTWLEARETVRTRSIPVPYSDLDLTRPEGRATLGRRVAGAVERVCAPRPYAMEIRRQQNYSECLAQAEVGARQQLQQLLTDEAQDRAELRVGPGRR